jgi:phosphate-selective porin OprO and OprP
MRTFASAVSALSALLLAPLVLAQPAPPPPAPVPAPDAPPTPPTPGAEPTAPPAPPGADVPPPRPPVPDPPPADAATATGPDGASGQALPPSHPPVAPRPAGLPPVPLAPPAIFPSQLSDLEEDEELVGIHGGRIFIRTPHDEFRFYPQVRLRTDFYSTLGGPDMPKTQGGENLHPSLAIRRLRLEMSGEILERLAFTGGVELGGGRIGDSTYAGADTSRWARVNAHDGRVRPGEVSISYRFREWLNLTAGLFNTTFSMSNRTREYATTFMERNIAIRGFAVPYDMDLGLSVWGEFFGDRTLAYEVGIFMGDGIDRPTADGRADYMGRIFARPLTSVGSGLFYQQAQIGMSMRHGDRDQDFVDYDYPAIATNQGFVLWQPGYVDSLGRETHVIPSGAQRAIGGELRLPFRLPNGAVIEVRGEAYYMVNDTREAVEGFLSTNTERLGRVKGLGWYAQIDWWACFTDQLANGEPGIYRPYTVDLNKEEPILKALQLSGIGAGILGNYQGATRLDSVPDPRTPDANIAIYQIGSAATFWFSHTFRATMNYLMYFTPESLDTQANLAVVPDNVTAQDDGQVGQSKLHHELGMRLAVTF